jgi:hypothetical protein
VFSGPGDDRCWGIWATGGYAAAAVLAGAWRSHGRQAALAAALAGALAGPLAWLAITAPATADVQVVMRSGTLLLRHATPYLSAAQLTHGGWLAYNPYLPAMALFGLPHALGLPGLAGDTRPWLAAATLLLLIATFRVAAFRAAAPRPLTDPAPRPLTDPAPRPLTDPAPRPLAAPLRRALFATATPVLAFPLALGITDPPVLALACLALALLIRPAWAAAAGPGWAAAAGRRTWPAALVLGVACALKYTAWPALPVLAVMIAVQRGPRAAARFAAATLATAFALSAALAPRSLASPGALIQNTVSFPLGLTHAHTPAQSPLPGHLLATIGPAGHLAAIILLVVAGLAVTASLIIHPPADSPAAARRLALGLALMFALSPATRFGYLAYPVGLCGWIALSQNLTPRAGPAPRRWRAPALAAAPGGAKVRPPRSGDPPDRGRATPRDSVMKYDYRDARPRADRNGRDHPRLRGHGAERPAPGAGA